MISIADLVYSDWFYMFFQPAIVALLCTIVVRLFGRTEDKCPTWKDKFNMILIYFSCWFCCLFFIWLLMLANETWLAEYWNVDLIKYK